MECSYPRAESCAGRFYAHPHFFGGAYRGTAAPTISVRPNANADGNSLTNSRVVRDSQQ